MPDRSNVAYFYDGSLAGFFCCVFDSFDRKENPAAILPHSHAQELLFDTHLVETQPEKAHRVARSIPQKIGPEADRLVQRAFLTNLEERELLMLDFLRLGFARGPRIMGALAQEPLNTLLRGVQALEHEAHLFTGFVRFSDYQGALTAVITPKNNVLPLMAEHFCQRFSCENFMIYDRVHKRALVHEQGKGRIVPLEAVQLPGPSQEELRARALWRKFYETIAIEQRTNPTCRRTHMPQRYWGDMTEFQTDDAPLSPQESGQSPTFLPQSAPRLPGC